MKKHVEIEFNDNNIHKLFGIEDAESESIQRLKEYYLKKDTYRRVNADQPLRILVGHKGTGKSALFKVSIAEEKENGNIPILIKPDDIADLGKDNDNFLLKVRQWKYGLHKIIGAKVFSELGYNDDNVTMKLSKFGLKLISFISETFTAVKDNVALAPAQRIMIDNFLKNKKIIVFIDDLDRGWEGKRDDIIRISALLNSIRDLSNENEGIIFKVSLRSDVYYLVRTSDESTDKIEGSVVWFSWTNHEILVMLIKRVLTFFGTPVNEKLLLNSKQKDIKHLLDDIMEPIFEGKGNWEKVAMYKVLMSLTRKRPRDLVKLCTLAAREAYNDGSNKLASRHFQAIFEEYSQGRIQDTINEYKSELNNIEKLIFGMKPNRKVNKDSDGFIFTTIELRQKINNIKQQCNFIFANGKPADANELANFLFKINFITARKILENGEIERKYFEENRYLSSTAVDFGFDWEIHPAFRWVLQPDSLNTIFTKLNLSAD